MKLSDYVIDFISNHTKRVFLVVGGGAMHLNDSLGKHKELEYTAMLHEQGAAYAACGYGQVTNKLGVCMVTTGPGGTNAVTGVLAAWMDSIPVLFISGQVQTLQMTGTSGLRFKGGQEADIVSIVSPITKYAVTVTEPSQIRWILGRAIHEAQNGRKGPVWVDIPLDVQAADIEPNRIEKYTVGYNEWQEWQTSEDIRYGVAQIEQALAGAKKPVILAGGGIIAANAEDDFHKLLERLKCPVLLTWKAMGLMSDNHPLYCGRPGAIGQRAANRIQQSADVLIVLGAQMNYDQVAYQLEWTAPDARTFVVDIDPAELAKFPEAWTCIKSDIKQFIKRLKVGGEYASWLKECKKLVKDNPVIE